MVYNFSSTLTEENREWSEHVTEAKEEEESIYEYQQKIGDKTTVFIGNEV